LVEGLGVGIVWGWGIPWVVGGWYKWTASCVGPGLNL
jgi:hypothetical protein